MRAYKPKTATLKVLLFSLGHLYLAIRLEGVQKVIPMPEVIKSGAKRLGVAHFEDREAIVLDLFQTIYDRSATKGNGYLVVLETDQNLYGITVPTLPMMKEIPVADFRPVPADYRDRDALGIAEQMTQIALNPTQDVTVLLLDPQRLLNLVR
jgi:chemotaxis signal transduction protein